MGVSQCPSQGSPVAAPLRGGMMLTVVPSLPQSCWHWGKGPLKNLFGSLWPSEGCVEPAAPHLSAFQVFIENLEMGCDNISEQF